MKQQINSHIKLVLYPNQIPEKLEMIIVWVTIVYVGGIDISYSGSNYKICKLISFFGSYEAVKSAQYRLHPSDVTA